MINNILIVCIGNICRSPMAEALLKEKIKTKQLSSIVSSAGLNALVGCEADPLSQELMKMKGLNISHHRARQITSDMVAESDLILTMSTEQQIVIETEFFYSRGRVHRLGKWGEYDILDPYKRHRAVFEQSLTLIDQGINDWYKKLWN